MINREIIQRYLDGEATEAELQLLQTYLGGKDLSLLKEWMAQDWETLPGAGAALPPDLSEDMLRQVKQQISSSENRKLKKIRQRQYLAMAASFLLLVSLGFGLWWSRFDTLLVHATGFGEWETLTLPDGSWVKLNANSEIRYAPHWQDDEDRKVWLNGEAFFKVQQKPATGAKFQVITKDLQVEVLGTSFNVNSRGVQTNVFLEEGHIRLSMGDQEEMLEAGDFLAYSAEKQAVMNRQNAISPELHTSWKDGVLMLKDQSIAEILKRLEEIYGVQIQVLNDSLLTHIKTVSVPMDKLEIAIPVLERTFEVNITKQENQLILQ